MERTKPVDILLVEDNEGDVFLTKKAFMKAKVANDIRVASDGEVAMNMLHRKEGYANAPRPDIEVADFGITHLSLRQADVFAVSDQFGVRIFFVQAVNKRCIGLRDGADFGIRAVTPSVEDD